MCCIGMQKMLYGCALFQKLAVDNIEKEKIHESFMKSL